MASSNALKSGVLSRFETFGQSIVNVAPAPTATAALILSQVFALSPNKTWLAYLIATPGRALRPAVAPVLLTILAINIAGTLAYRDVSMSARLMFILEGVSIAIILIIVGYTLYRHGGQPDHDQLRLGLMLAIFGSVRFESPSSLGAKARNVLGSVWRAVMLSAVGSGTFFTVCSCVEVLGFRGASQSLVPQRFLALRADIRLPGTLMDVSAAVSFFSCGLACISAAGRVLCDMEQKGDLHQAFGDPHRASRNLCSRGQLTATSMAISITAVAVMSFAFAGSLDGPARRGLPAARYPKTETDFA